MINLITCLKETSNGQVTLETFNRTTGDKGLKVVGSAHVKVPTVDVSAGVEIDKKKLDDVITSVKRTFSPDLAGLCTRVAVTNPKRGGARPGTAKARPSSVRPAAESAGTQPEASVSVLPSQHEADTTDRDNEIKQGILRGRQLEKAEKNDAAWEEYSRAFDLSDRSSMEAAGLLGLLAFRMGDVDKAKYFLRSALDRVGTDHWVKANRTSLETTLQKALVLPRGSSGPDLPQKESRPPHSDLAPDDAVLKEPSKSISPVETPGISMLPGPRPVSASRGKLEPRKAAALGLGAGAVLAFGGALAFKLWGDSTYNQAKAETDPGKQIDLWNSANNKLYAAEGLVVAGLGCGAVSLWLYFRGDKNTTSAERPPARVTLRPLFDGTGRAGISLRGTY